MSYAQRMIQTNPNGPAVEDTATLVECIEACFDCAQACSACADACLGEGEIQMLARCLRLDLDCANVCESTGKKLSRQTAFDLEMARVALEGCAQACRLCGDECEQHARHMEHCRVCAEACRRCESACDSLLSAMIGST
jgi:hypothetical protein